MAGARNTSKGPWPMDPKGEVDVVLFAGNITGTGTDDIVDWVVPWNCFCRGYSWSYKKIGNNLTDVGIVTIDDSKNIMAVATLSANVDGVRVAPHTHVAKDLYEINAGDRIRLTVNSTAGQTAYMHIRLHLVPVFFSADAKSLLA